MKNLKIGMIGLDTSHAVIFTRLLNDTSEKFHVVGGKVYSAFPGGSPEFELSWSRVKGFTTELEKNYGVSMVRSIEQVAEENDAILLESVDGAQHLEQLRKIVHYQKPIFIDKPFSTSLLDMKEMITLAERYGTPIMSTSALRFSVELREVLEKKEFGKVVGADCYGPMEVFEKPPGFFWYGIHAIEMLYTIYGIGCQRVTTVTTDDHDVITGVWKDGRIGTVRGNRVGNNEFGSILHYESLTEFVTVTNRRKPFYASLLEEIITFFQSGESPVSLYETEEIIRFIVAANESRQTGMPVYL